MEKIVVISGSPFSNSRIDTVLDYVKGRLVEKKYLVISYHIQDFKPEDLTMATMNSPLIKKFINDIEEASGLVIGSPVYKASITGVLKALFDLIPQNAFNNKQVLPIMLGGSKMHLLTIEYVLKPLISTLKGQSTQGIYFVDSDIDKQLGCPIAAEDLLIRLEHEMDQLLLQVKNVQKVH